MFITKKQILGWLIAALLGSGGWLASTEPIPLPAEPAQSDLAEFVSPSGPIVSPEGPNVSPGEEVVSADNASRYDDGQQLPAGAHLHCPPAHRQRCAQGFWRRGPLRRAVSAPVRWLFWRRCRWR